MTEKNERYYYQDFGEYCTITDTKEHPKTLNDFYNELVNDGYLEDYDGDKEVVLELAEEKYHDYLEDNCLSPIDVVRRLNEQEELIKRLKQIREEQIETTLKLKRKINELEKENEKLKRYNKSQELEIVRLHKLADAMSGVLKELGVYDVYDEEQISSVKEKLK